MAAIGAATAALLLALPMTLQPIATAEPTGTEDSENQESTEPSEQQTPGLPEAPNQPDNNNSGNSGVGKPRLQGTYTHTVTYGTATESVVLHFTSGCAGCNAAGAGGAQLNWTGAGWEQTYVGACGPVLAMFVPTSVVDGYAQSLTSTTTGMCGQQAPAIGTLVRTGP